MKDVTTMTEPTAKLDASDRHGIPVAEIVDVLDSPAGTVIRTTDGASYVDVPASNPDGAGKTGLMFLSPPSSPYTGSFPVYTQPAPDEDAAAPAKAKKPAPAPDDGTKSRSDLVARAKELGVELRPRMSVDAIAEAIAEAEAAATAGDEDEAGDEEAGDEGDSAEGADDEGGADA